MADFPDSYAEVDAACDCFADSARRAVEFALVDLYVDPENAHAAADHVLAKLAAAGFALPDPD